MKVNLILSSIIMLVLPTACSEEVATPYIEKHVWSPYMRRSDDNFIIFDFKVLDDGQLYATGMIDTQFVFSKRIHNSWIVLAQVEENGIADFTIFNDTIYYSTNTAIKRARGTFVEVIVKSDGGSVAVFENKLFMSANNLKFRGSNYTLMSYDSAGTLTPIDNGVQGGALTKLGNKLFFSGVPAKVYENGSYTVSDYPGGGYLSIDNNGVIYNWISYDGNHASITRFVNGAYENVGNKITTRTIFDKLVVNGSLIVISGVDADTFASRSYFLSKKNVWTEIPTVDDFFDIITFEHNIFIATDKGEMLRLAATRE
ncbi:MAG TPA: hypothetical protein VK666_10355 [Chryseolinea sp.]|nr:hypothetical protein [Chryseolinea sp.]